MGRFGRLRIKDGSPFGSAATAVEFVDDVFGGAIPKKLGFLRGKKGNSRNGAGGTRFPRPAFPSWIPRHLYEANITDVEFLGHGFQRLPARWPSGSDLKAGARALSSTVMHVRSRTSADILRATSWANPQRPPWAGISGMKSRGHNVIIHGHPGAGGSPEKCSATQRTSSQNNTKQGRATYYGVLALRTTWPNEARRETGSSAAHKD